jgi:hypothetical protein
VINSFRDPRPVVPCANCDKPLVGIPMDAGDFYYVYEDHEHPHSIWKKEGSDA